MPAIHRLRMHDDGIRLRQLQPLRRQAVLREIPIRVGQRCLAHALLLDAQHHDHIRILQALGQGRMAGAAGEFARLRHEHRRGDDAQFADAERGQDVVGRARDARMADVPDDGDRKLGKVRLALLDGQGIEQPLGGMGHMRLARREHADMRPHVIGHQPGDAFLGIADHQHVHMQRFEGIDGVEHALALDARGQLQLQIDDIRAEPLRGQFEGHARAGGGLGEQIRDRDAREVARGRRRLAQRPHVGLRAFEQVS